MGDYPPGAPRRGGPEGRLYRGRVYRRAPEDPQFTIDDLLPHLGVEQSKKPLGEAIPGESLNLLIGSRPFKDDEAPTG
mgnify:CR=1 FL=1